MSEPFLGEIRMVGFNYAPVGWAPCDGRLLPIAQNSALFALLGTTYGGDGVANFALPDLRGRAAVGMGNGPGLTPIVQGQRSGNESVTLTNGQLPQHTHPASFAGQASGVSGSLSTSVSVDVGTSTANPMVPPTTGATTFLSAATGKVGLNSVVFNGLYTNTAPDATKAQLGGITASTNAGALSSTAAGTVTVGPAGSSLPVPLRNPYLGSNFIIALEGIFPTRP
ncbi:phage tail protein [Mitsuaria sp. WAJ17]|uniref:phage tail protein n=1 Tax=Mitsuaria sp. WAJ17 TaxID=2761452 RepID=UPI00160305B5|nr:tail fiber protein [Mitsuaria sp. WAJ17]MBB2483635.1 phage tail protein [Mitsuaria sp. WAJ17]